MPRRRRLVFLCSLLLALSSGSGAIAQPAADQSTAASGKNEPPKVLIYKGAVPEDPNYLAYQRWYKNLAIVDLFVDGRSSDHLLKALQEVALLRRKKVTVGKVFVIGGEFSAQLDALADSLGKAAASGDSSPVAGWLGNATAIATAARRAGLSAGTATMETEEFLKAHKIVQSPTWIVTHRGNQHIYEGFPSVVRHFTAAGVFNDAATEGARW